MEPEVIMTEEEIAAKKALEEADGTTEGEEPVEPVEVV